MNRLLEVCLITLTLAAVPRSAAAQSVTGNFLQRGMSVNLPVTNNATTLPDADREDAVVVTITQDGNVFFGINAASTAALAEQVKAALSNRTEKTLYIKADAGTPYASLVKLLDAVRPAGVERLALLTAQPDDSGSGRPVAPKGLELQVVQPQSMARHSLVIEER